MGMNKKQSKKKKIKIITKSNSEEAKEVKISISPKKTSLKQKKHKKTKNRMKKNKSRTRIRSTISPCTTYTANKMFISDTLPEQGTMESSSVALETSRGKLELGISYDSSEYSGNKRKAVTLRGNKNRGSMN